MKVVVAVVFATRVKRGKRAWMNAVTGHWNVTRPLGHSVVSFEILWPYISDQFCFIAYNRRETDSVDNNTGCSPMLYSIASLRCRRGERFDSDLFGLLR